MLKIEVKGLTKIFGKNPKQGIKLLQEGKTKPDILKETGMTVGVNRVSFEVHSGEIFVIMGLSGSGKSTLVRLINRLIEPNAGSVLVDGEDLAKMDKHKLRETRRKKLSMVFQGFGLFPHRTILENAGFGLEIQGMDKKEIEEKALESLQLVGLKGYEDQYPSQLSGGMKQRVGLARALANNPDILLMDEAFSALDPLNRKEMQDELIDLQATMHKTIIFITHDLDEALKIGDRIAIMKNGLIVQVGTPEEIMTNPADEYVRKFVEDVDRSKVFSAQHVMKRPETIDVEKHGPRVALKRMRQAGISSIYVINKNKEFLGVVTADAAAEAVKNGTKDIYDVMITDVPVVLPDLSLNDLFEIIHDSPVPVAVVEEKILKGIIVRGAVLAALAGNEVNNDETNTNDTNS
ncbi:glycine betaine/L-proline ABC transporter ATP-binding protein [Clostridium sp. CM028]|uniref:quaternary amine ABC transporter ATP-binding protein n=1 Tax=unclassified Clostridium TaxID=2614128 RepID=UPI001C0DE254|nr:MULTISPECIES: glycine betaine/L-proline ABC transporter ATP-binding protein [unclassified Clostridium]MBU3092934.1 glycine betaine/L-proline ABC transporter ATP-binding protein [Clostridium sp. CF011]MBW9146318.1 glycine betaine/L-proline ABC transporter ATP-binding protein [Clostridium sp. CM027]MBW9149968.1 glycine betaine/L-proline ABC transporter ATP-binding protein [Clostridium sp. CM028]UVE41861.1 glycine betaine/L-proline ABC transporter ATP-binding protein [Clostridium sp. CM027]WAG